MAGCPCYNPTTTIKTVLRPFFRDHPGEPVPEDYLWTLWCNGRLAEADTPTIRLGATPSRLTSAHLHHPHFLQTGCPSCRPTNSVKALKANEQRENTEKNFSVSQSLNLSQSLNQIKTATYSAWSTKFSTASRTISTWRQHQTTQPSVFPRLSYRVSNRSASVISHRYFDQN